MEEPITTYAKPLEQWIAKPDLIKIFEYAYLLSMCVAPAAIQHHFGCENFDGRICDLFKDIKVALETNEPLHISDGLDDHYTSIMEAITKDLQLYRDGDY